jgi:hypothetical protein
LSFLKRLSLLWIGLEESVGIKGFKKQEIKNLVEIFDFKILKPNKPGLQVRQSNGKLFFHFFNPIDFRFYKIYQTLAS